MDRPTDLRTRIEAALVKPGVASSDFDLNPGIVLPEGRKLRAASVLVPFMRTDAGVVLVLTLRSSALKHHPGQIAFPGGKKDPGDATLADTALREAEEEIALPKAAAHLLGRLPLHETVTGFDVLPHVAWIEHPVQFKAEPGEVDEVFCVPAHHILDRASFQTQSRHWRGTERHYFTVPYGPYYIWGATARMLHSLAVQMAR